MIFPLTRTKCICFLLALAVVGTATYFIVRQHQDINDSNKGSKGAGAVVANGEECAAIGMNILKNHNGSAADAAIATLFCEGVTCTQSMGLGGGFVMTIYNRAKKTMETLIARERAPNAAYKEMFDNVASVEGILSVAVPGELKGYWELHKRYGQVAWKTLVEPTIELCTKGHLVTRYLAKVLTLYEHLVYNSSSLSEVFVNPQTKKVWVAGDRIRRLDLARTLQVIANEGADALYSRNGTLLKPFVNEIQTLGGIITEEDLIDYKVEWAKPLSTTLPNENTLYTISVPGSGAILAYILNILKDRTPEDTPAYLQQIIESYKFGYAKRTLLGDNETDPNLLQNLTSTEFARTISALIKLNATSNDVSYYGANFSNIDDHGTAHINVLASNGDAVSVTSSINTIFGSKIRSRTTGIILNDEMDDFGTNKKNVFGLSPSPANYIKPRKRPLSSMSPTIILDKNDDAVLLIGSAGGSRITTSVAYTIINHLWLNHTLSESIKKRRIHHQLLPMQIYYEDGFDQKSVNALLSFGHKMVEEKAQIGFSAVTAISRVSGKIEAVTDMRRHGSFAIY